MPELLRNSFGFFEKYLPLYFLGFVHSVLASDFHICHAIIRGQVRPLEIELKKAAIRGCSYLTKQCINYGVDINALEVLNMPIFPKINGLNHVSFFPAIHIASIMGQIDVVKILI